MIRNITIGLALVLSSASIGNAAVVWSSSFESYNENDNIVVNNTTGEIDTLSSFIDGSEINAPLVARTPSGGATLATGLAANVNRGISSSNGAIQFDRANLPNLDDGGIYVLSFDLQQLEWSSNQLLRAYSGGTAAGSFAMAGNFGNGAMRSFWIMNRTGAPVDLPHNLRETAPGPDNVNDDTYAGFSRRDTGTLFNHPSSSTDVTLNPPFSPGTPINRVLYNDNGGGQTAARNNWYDNFIITDSVDDAFIGPDGQWRSALDLTVGTRPTSSFLASGSTPSFTGSVVNGVDFTPSLTTSGTAMVNGPVLDITDTDAGWISFTQPSTPYEAETILLLDLESSTSQFYVDYVVNELQADAELRGYTISTDHNLLNQLQYADFEVAMTFSDLASGDYNFSLRLGGNGSVTLDQLAIVSPAPIPEPGTLGLLSLALCGLLYGARSRQSKT